jgi:chromosome segregation ATPase
MEEKIDKLTAIVTKMAGEFTEMKSDISELKSDVSELKSDVSGLKSDVAELKEKVNEVDTTLTEYIGYQEGVNDELRAENRRILELVGDENSLAAAHSKIANHDTRIHKLELAAA